MRICIDAGHGGSDSGAVAKDGTLEKNLVLEYSKTLGDLLAARHDVLFTRLDDSFVGLTLRAHKANDWNADCFVSLHANAASNVMARGHWVIKDDDTVHGSVLATHVWRQMAAVPGIADSDPAEEVYPDNSPWVGNRELAVVSKTTMPAILVELGFLTNVDDLKRLKNPDVRLQVCRAIAIGLEKWGESRGLFKPPLPIPDIDIAGDEPVYISYTRAPVRNWRKPASQMVSEEALEREANASYALRSIRGLVESSEAQDLLSGAKRGLINLVLGWLEDLLKALLGVKP